MLTILKGQSKVIHEQCHFPKLSHRLPSLSAPGEQHQQQCSHQTCTLSKLRVLQGPSSQLGDLWGGTKIALHPPLPVLPDTLQGLKSQPQTQAGANTCPHKHNTSKVTNRTSCFLWVTSTLNAGKPPAGIYFGPTNLVLLSQDLRHTNSHRLPTTP